MMAHFRLSPVLKRLRVTRRCYSLLNNARIAPENLHTFYRTYRLPADPFFPLYFAVKRGYLAERARKRDERARYILEQVRSLPPPILAEVRYLGNLERHYNAAGRYPIWQRCLYPSSKKRARELASCSREGWRELFRNHLHALVRRYKQLTAAEAERIEALFVLDLFPGRTPPSMPSRSDVNRSYRRLSMLYHPDRGGEAAAFRELKWARDLLIGPHRG